MEEKRMNEAARKAGFEKAALIPVKDLVFHHEFRKFCEENACGNYGKNYGCPPYCGTPQEMEDKVRGYDKALVFQSRTLVKDIFDDQETKKIKKEHTKRTLQVLEELKKEGLSENGFPVMCGPCNYCKVCKMQESAPCVNETMKFSCLSAYCIDAAAMANRCDMEIQWNGNIASFFSIYIFDRK